MSLSKRNSALNANTNTVNGRTADIAITRRGSDLYFAISAAMAVSGFLILLFAWRKPRRNRIFHYISAAIVFVAAIAYFTMGSNLGFTPIQVEFFRNRPVVRGRYREIFYVRYIDWFITTPLLLTDLLLTAKMPWAKIFWVVLVDWVMIVMGLVGALVTSRYKWAYFAIGCFALLYILYELAWTARRRASRLGPDISRTFMTCGCLTLLIWMLYPIAWGLCEGGNYISPDSEAIFYSILDFIAKPIFSLMLLWGHRKIDPARLGVSIMDYDHDEDLDGTHPGKEYTGRDMNEPGYTANESVSTTHGGSTLREPDFVTTANPRVTRETPNITTTAATPPVYAPPEGTPPISPGASISRDMDGAHKARPATPIIPETTRPETTRPETARPETTRPETTRSSRSWAEVTAGVGTERDTTSSEARHRAGLHDTGSSTSSAQDTATPKKKPGTTSSEALRKAALHAATHGAA